MYLEISNYGEVDSRAFSLMGASTKRGDESKIGMFGSGNKFGIAYLMRNRIPFKIFSGQREIKITTKAETMREVAFEVIHIDGQPTSLTTTTGKDWELWQAIREFYANAIDEGGVRFCQSSKAIGQAGRTSMFIEMLPPVAMFYEKIDDYFTLNRRPLHEISGVKLFPKIDSKVQIYRKGILAYQTVKPSVFDYDLNEAQIDEQRLIRDVDDAITTIWKGLYQMKDRVLISELLDKMNPNFLEWRIDSMWITTNPSNFSEEWIGAIAGRWIAPDGVQIIMSSDEIEKTLFLPTQLFKDLNTRFYSEIKLPPSLREGGADKGYVINKPSELDEITIKKVFDFFEECNFEVSFRDVKLGKFKDRRKWFFEPEFKRLIVSKEFIEKGKENLARLVIEISLSDEENGDKDDLIEALSGKVLTLLKQLNSHDL